MNELLLQPQQKQWSLESDRSRVKFQIFCILEYKIWIGFLPSLNFRVLWAQTGKSTKRLLFQPFYYTGPVFHIYSMVMNWSKLQETVEDRGAWCATVHRVRECWHQMEYHHPFSGNHCPLVVSQNNSHLPCETQCLNSADPKPVVSADKIVQGSWFLWCPAAAKSLQSCLTLCDPIDGSPPGSPVPGILQARHFHLQCVKVKSESEVAQSCPTLSDPMDCSLPGSSVHGIF